MKKTSRFILPCLFCTCLMLLYYKYYHFGESMVEKKNLIITQIRKQEKRHQHKKTKIPFTILLHTRFFGRPWSEKYPLGRTECQLPSSYSQCVFTDDHQYIHSSHAVLFHGNDLLSPRKILCIPRNPHQIWIFMTQENPLTTNTGVYKIKDYNGVFNWTATYHHTSNVVTPYYDVIKSGYKNQSSKLLIQNLALLMKSKMKLVIGIMSNCVEYRLEFIRNLRKHVDVDLYGKCKNKVNPGISEQCDQFTEECDQLQKSYKFFLAIENFYCSDYVTEKFYHEALQKGLVPIVLNGAKMSNVRVAPPGSFINILDFKDAHHLGNSIRYLYGNNTAYLQYHQWRRDYRIVDHDYTCNFCKTLNKKFSNVRRWPPLKLSDKWNDGMCKRYSNDIFQKYLK